MGSQPLISICIPCYNNEAFIAWTLESLRKQRVADYEIVISDDRSTDRTVSLIKQFTDPRIRLNQNGSNLGLGRNWNKVLSCARGKYIKLLCADDLLYPECLARQVAVLEDPANSGVVLAVCNRDVINAHNDLILRRGFPFRPGRISGQKLIRHCIRWGANLIGEPAVGLFKREALNQTRMCDPSNPYYVDLVLWAELLKLGDAFIDPEYLAAFRVSDRSASAKIGRHQAAYFRRFVRTFHSEPFYEINWFDQALGCSLSLLLCLLRNAFIAFHSRQRRWGRDSKGRNSNSTARTDATSCASRSSVNEPRFGGVAGGVHV